MAEKNIKLKIHEILANPRKEKGVFTIFGVKVYREDKIEYKEIKELVDELIKAWKKILKEYENYGIKYMFELWEGSIYVLVFVPIEDEKNVKYDNIFILDDGKMYEHGKYQILDIDWDENEIILYFPK